MGRNLWGGKGCSAQGRPVLLKESPCEERAAEPRSRALQLALPVLKWAGHTGHGSEAGVHWPHTPQTVLPSHPLRELQWMASGDVGGAWPTGPADQCWGGQDRLLREGKVLEELPWVREWKVPP